VTNIILLMVLSTLGPSAVIAVISYAGIMALSRNPSSAPKIQMTMILGYVFAESIAVIALLVIFHLYAGRVG
jgi:F0F1-type ATP synthase membrane subunit c/vacuolar-type H+-ATPase subunit K